MELDLIEAGTEWHELFYEESVEVDDTIEVSDSTLIFETKSGIKYTEYRNHRKFDIIDCGPASNPREAAKLLLNMRKTD